jgi:DNA-binding transcriptional LysR family regulator
VKYPNIQVHFHSTLLNNMAQEVLSNKVDLAVSVLPLDHPNLDPFVFTEGRMVCVVPQGHELTRQAKVSIKDLSSYPLITHDPGIPFGQLVSAAFRKASVSASTCIHIHQTDVACALVRAGAGVAMVDEFTVEGLGWETLKVLPLAEDIPLTPSVVRSKFGSASNHADKFVEVLIEQTKHDRQRALND